jgi:endonuclease-3
MPSRVDEKRKRIARILRGLIAMYGPRAYERAGSGVDVLVRATLSQNTNGSNSERGYRMLRRRFPTWEQVADAPVREVQREIAICGLARVRSYRLQAMLKRIRDERGGAIDLEWLADESPEHAFEYLMSFRGVGPKTAALVMLFGFGMAILPVDNGILRVVKRLRLVRSKARDLEAERVLSPVMARGSHYALHVLTFEHAKEKCRPRNPKCDECQLVDECPFGQRRLRHAAPTGGDRDDEIVRVRRRLARFASAGLARRSPRSKGDASDEINREITGSEAR